MIKECLTPKPGGVQLSPTSPCFPAFLPGIPLRRSRNLPPCPSSSDGSIRNLDHHFGHQNHVFLSYPVQAQLIRHTSSRPAACFLVLHPYIRTDGLHLRHCHLRPPPKRPRSKRSKNNGKMLKKSDLRLRLRLTSTMRKTEGFGVGCGNLSRQLLWVCTIDTKSGEAHTLRVESGLIRMQML
jgi:hypothetical protein